MKRKNEESQNANGSAKKRAISDTDAKDCFGKDVFPKQSTYSQEYAQSQP
jgi:hypothetical protein